MAAEQVILRDPKFVVMLAPETPMATVVQAGNTADFGRAFRTISGQSFPEVDKSDFIAKYLVGDAEGDPVPSDGTVTGGDATLRTDLATPASGAHLVAYERASGVPQSVYHFIIREKTTPLEYGAVGDDAADDTAACDAAILSGKRVRLPIDFTFKSTGGHIMPDGSQIEGDGGKIDFDASVGQWLLAPGASGTAVDVDDISIQNVHFISSSDRGFMHIVRLTNLGIMNRFDFLWNVVEYTATPSNSQDRWVLASAGAGGVRTNFNINHNRVYGPMQLIASGGSDHTTEHWDILHNYLWNTRSNAISMVSTGALGSGANTMEHIRIGHNEIFADDYTAIGVLLGIDQTSTDKAVIMRDIQVYSNNIDIVDAGSGQSDIFVRLGNLSGNLGGGFDSVCDRLVLYDNDIRGGISFSQEPPDFASGLSRATNFEASGNRFHGGDIIFSHLDDGAVVKNNTATPGSSSVRLGGNNGTIYSAFNQWSSFIPIAAECDFDWRSVSDNYRGHFSGGAGTDRVIQARASVGYTQTITLEKPTVNSLAGTPYASLSATGTGTSDIIVRDLSSTTAWAINPSGYERSGNGTINDRSGGEIFGMSESTANIAPGESSPVYTLANVYGSQVGDRVEAWFSGDSEGLLVSAQVKPAGTISWYFVNPGGNPAGTINTYKEVLFRWYPVTN